MMEVEMSIRDYTEAELKQELKRKENIRRQKQIEAVREERRIYNLPENVAARKAANEKAAYQRILSKSRFSENEEGIWSIYGEDPNCDLGGHHSNPYLGKVEGTLGQAIRYAINLNGFFTWGGGGHVEKAAREKVKKLS